MARGLVPANSPLLFIVCLSFFLSSECLCADDMII